MNLYRRMFTTLRELTRLRAKYEQHENEAEAIERRGRWVFDATMVGESQLASGALVSSPADVDALMAGWKTE